MEKSQSLKVDKTLIELLRKQSGTPFSTTDIRDFYIHQIPDGQRPGRNQLRKYIYKELLRLESVKLVERHEESTGRGCKFIFCPENSCVELETKSAPFESSDPHVESTVNAGLKVTHLSGISPVEN